MTSAAAAHPDDEATAKVERPLMAVHVVIRDIRSSKLLEATATRVRIGRSPDCEIPLGVGPSEGVSRVHCEFGLDEFTSVVLRDSGSTNGTLLNGHLINGPVRVAAGQAIALGDQGPTLIIEQVSLRAISAE